MLCTSSGTPQASRALQGDGALSGIGAASSLLALTALVYNDTLGWWQADRVAALIVAAIAAAERGTPHHATERAPETRLALCSARSDERSGLPLNDLAPSLPPTALHADSGRQQGPDKMPGEQANVRILTQRQPDRQLSRMTYQASDLGFCS
jgi:hypothetical protein